MKICFAFLLFLGSSTLVQAHEKEKEEEEEEEDPYYIQGITVLGLLVLLTVLYRLLNAKRQETREITWKMLSGTISIFAGVVIYNILSELVVIYKKHGPVIEDEQDSFAVEHWVSSFWTFGLYMFFLWSISCKACLGPCGNCQGVKQRLQIIKGAHRHTAVDRMISLFGCNELAVKTASEVLTADERATIDRSGSQLDAGRSSYKSTVCSIVGSLFWAHAIAFAGIDGWNATQQQWCCKDKWERDEEWKCEDPEPFHKQLFWSSVLIVNQIGMYYFMLRAVGIFWRFVLLRYIEAKHFHLAKWVFGKEQRLTKKAAEGTDGVSAEGFGNIGVKSLDLQTDPWKEWKHEEEDEESEELEDGFVKFEKQPAEAGRGLLGKVRYVTEEKACPWPQPKGGSTAATPLVAAHEFDSPNFYECFYRAGEDYMQVPVYAVPVHDELIELWDDVRKDGENDFFAMSISFLFVQTLRLLLTGELPNKMEDEDEASHDWTGSLWLGLLTALFLFLAYHAYAGLVDARKGKHFQENNAVISGVIKFVQYVGDVCLWVCVSVFIYFYFFHSSNKPTFDVDGGMVRFWVSLTIWDRVGICVSFVLSGLIFGFSHRSPTLNALERKGETDFRAIDIFVNILLLSASWSAMFASEWMLAHSKWSTFTSNGFQKGNKFSEGLLTINVAIWVTGVVFLSIWLLDFILLCRPSTASSQRDTHKGAFDKINTCLGLLIGFVWEAEFDKAVEHIADRMTEHYQSGFKIGAGCGVLFFLLPVWFNSIIPMSEEQGYKFGFVFRRLHARLQCIHEEVFDHSMATTRGKEHRKHIKDHKEHINEIVNIFNRITHESLQNHAEPELGRSAISGPALLPSQR
mmetsp:Transcript_56770/g.99256  ORF Transcript_56770/g.99256 Transcript_56770/m.99256 type:complete len:857 (+) Transcript_56770:134-2704(+)